MKHTTHIRILALLLCLLLFASACSKGDPAAAPPEGSDDAAVSAETPAEPAADSAAPSQEEGAPPENYPAALPRYVQIEAENVESINVESYLPSVPYILDYRLNLGSRHYPYTTRVNPGDRVAYFTNSADAALWGEDGVMPEAYPDLTEGAGSLVFQDDSLVKILEGTGTWASTYLPQVRGVPVSVNGQNAVRTIPALFSVSTPAGQFSGCAAAELTAGNTSTVTYYAPGIGAVLSVQRTGSSSTPYELHTALASYSEDPDPAPTPLPLVEYVREEQGVMIQVGENEDGSKYIIFPNRTRADLVLAPNGIYWFMCVDTEEEKIRTYVTFVSEDTIMITTRHTEFQYDGTYFRR